MLAAGRGEPPAGGVVGGVRQPEDGDQGEQSDGSGEDAAGDEGEGAARPAF
ncbi:hypothetical protein [Streptomyces sp. SID5473]|uniref:hypothetical protein n=1 Tax=Streptomyces sp. SID5473 TaxID=2690299 RepID=UPI001F2905CA|nr:hypothetical protein [Streptomyces sp. SID5473]